MISFILICYGLSMFVEALFIKWGYFEKLSQIGARQNKSKFIYEITNCRFCLMFYITIAITIIISFFNGFDKGNLIVPFVVSGLLTLKTR